jgi:hypothetical protein
MAGRVDLNVIRIKIIDVETTSRDGLIKELAAKFAPNRAVALAA